MFLLSFAVQCLQKNNERRTYGEDLFLSKYLTIFYRPFHNLCNLRDKKFLIVNDAFMFYNVYDIAFASADKYRLLFSERIIDIFDGVI